MTIDNNRTECS